MVIRRDVRRRAVQVALFLVSLFGSNPGLSWVLADDTPRIEGNEPFEFETEDGERVVGELGVLIVPENRADANSRSIRMAYLRIPTTGRGQGRPLVCCPAGPGGSGVREVQWFAQLFRPLRETHELIGIDPRGTGRSEPNLRRSFARALCIERRWTRDELTEVYRALAREAREYWVGEGVDLAGYNTREAADDIDALRAVLGYDSIDLLGFSYGTHLALSVIRWHGEHVHRAVLQGPEGPNHTYKMPGQIEEGLQEIERMVAADEMLSREIPSFIELVQRVLRTVRDEPVSVDIEVDGRAISVPVSEFDVALFIAHGIGRSERLTSLPRELIAMNRGDYSVIAERVVRSYRNIEINTAMGDLFDCASGATAERFQAIARQAADTVLGDVVNFPYPQICDGWEAADLGDSFRGPIVSSVPTLFMAGSYDSRTPISNALELLLGFENGILVTLTPAGHDWRLFDSPESTSTVIEFLTTGALERREIELPPFEFQSLEP